jgi:hypothetical protein
LGRWTLFADAHIKRRFARRTQEFDLNHGSLSGSRGALEFKDEASEDPKVTDEGHRDGNGARAKNGAPARHHVRASLIDADTKQARASGVA